MKKLFLTLVFALSILLSTNNVNALSRKTGIAISLTGVVTLIATYLYDTKYMKRLPMSKEPKEVTIAVVGSVAAFIFGLGVACQTR